MRKTMLIKDEFKLDKTYQDNMYAYIFMFWINSIKTHRNLYHLRLSFSVLGEYFVFSSFVDDFVVISLGLRLLHRRLLLCFALIISKDPRMVLDRFWVFRMEELAKCTYEDLAMTRFFCLILSWIKIIVIYLWCLLYLLLK